ncbi:MAG: rhomboid family intramembrane serine protease [Gammaproteobacteria bacterium]
MEVTELMTPYETYSVGHAPCAEIPLHKPPFWSFWLACIVLAVATATVFVLSAWLNDPQSVSRGITTLITASGLLALALAVRVLTRSRVPAPIRFLSAHMSLPAKPGASRAIDVPYEEVLSLDVWGRPPRQTLVLGTKDRLFVYPDRAFVVSDGIRLLSQEITSRILQRPDGRGHWEKIAHRQDLAKRLQRRAPRTTYLLLALITLVFGLQLATGAVQLGAGAVQSPLRLLDMGANAPSLVHEGQWFRLVAANFLHANEVHLGVNALALLSLGALLERLMGWQRFFTVYMCSAIGGALASTLAGKALFSVGASTALFGLLGALAVLNWRFRRKLPGGFYQPLRWWLFIIGINLALPLLMPQIDMAAHAGGLAAGVLTTYGLYRSVPHLDTAARLGSGAKAMFGVVCVVSLSGLIGAWAYFLNPDPHDHARFTQRYLQTAWAPPALLNNLAWGVAEDPGASSEELRTAYQSAAKALAAAPEESAFLDTLATLEYRLGLYEQAVATQRRALAQDGNAFAASQLARFLHAAQAKRGILSRGRVAITDAQLSLETQDKNAIRLALYRPFERGLIIFAHVLDNGGRVGLIQLTVGPQHKPEYLFENQGQGLPRGARLDIALLDAEGCGCQEGVAQWKYWPKDTRVDGLP